MATVTIDVAMLVLPRSNRLLRIFVPYWVVLIVAEIVTLLAYLAWGVSVSPTIAVLWLHGHELTFAAWVYAIWTNLFIVGMDLNHWLVYQDGAIVTTGAANLAVLNSLPSS